MGGTANWDSGSSSTAGEGLSIALVSTVKHLPGDDLFGASPILDSGVAVPPDSLYFVMDTFDGEGNGMGFRLGSANATTATPLPLPSPLTGRVFASTLQFVAPRWVEVSLLVYPSESSYVMEATVESVSGILSHALVNSKIVVETTFPLFFVAITGRTSATQGDTHAVSNVTVQCTMTSPPVVAGPPQFRYRGCYREPVDPITQGSLFSITYDTGSPTTGLFDCIRSAASSNEGSNFTLALSSGGVCRSCPGGGPGSSTPPCNFSAAGTRLPDELCPALGGPGLLQVWTAVGPWEGGGVEGLDTAALASNKRTASRLAAAVATPLCVAATAAAALGLLAWRRRQQAHDDLADAKSSQHSASNSAPRSFLSPAPMPVIKASELIVGELLGAGVSAVVHRAMWAGTPVAVKVWIKRTEGAEKLISGHLLSAAGSNSGGLTVSLESNDMGAEFKPPRCHEL